MHIIRTRQEVSQVCLTVLEVASQEATQARLLVDMYAGGA